MTHLERLFAALYLSEGWYIWWSERDIPKGRKNYARARAVVLFDRVLNIENLDLAYPRGIVNGACICGSWPGGECLRCLRKRNDESYSID